MSGVSERHPSFVAWGRVANVRRSQLAGVFYCPRSRIRRAPSVARGAAAVIDNRPASFQATGPASATRRDYDKVVGICPNNLSARFVRIARGRAGIIPRNYSHPAGAALFRATVGHRSRIFANGPRLWGGQRWAKGGKRCRNGAETVAKSGQVAAAKEGK